MHPRKKLSRFHLSFLLFSLISLIVIYATYLNLDQNWEPVTTAATISTKCPPYLLPYPSYEYLYNHGDVEQDECRKILGERSKSDTESECPDLFIIGARKGGTTSLYQYISKHPGFKGQGLDRKLGVGEVHYFSFTFTKRSWKEYLSKFGDKDRRLRGESSVSYLTSCMAPYRLRAMCGLRPKIVVLLREPVARMVSNYVMRYNTRGMREGLDVYVRDSITRDINAWENKLSGTNINNEQLLNNSSLCLFKPARNMIYEGLYSIHLKRWFKYFPIENFILWRTEDFHEHTSELLSELFADLGLTELDKIKLDEITSVRYNMYEYNISQVLWRGEEEKLQNIFQPFNKQLQNMLGDEYAW